MDGVYEFLSRGPDERVVYPCDWSSLTMFVDTCICRTDCKSGCILWLELGFN